MFRCCSRDEIVNAESEMTRAFATVGLLRHVVKATPIDQVCIYIVQTQQPWGLMQKVENINTKLPNFSMWRRHMTVSDAQDAARIKMMPTGVVKMAEDYLIRTFWKQIDHLRSSSCMHPDQMNVNYCGGRYSNRVRIYPKEVLNALSSIYVPVTGNLYDIRNAVTALHAVATPTMLDPPYWYDRRRGDNVYKFEERDFLPLQRNHMQKISALLSVLNEYCYKEVNRQSIPNEIEKNILLDLIESFLVMFGPVRFSQSYITRQTYEYMRLYDTLGDTDRNRYHQNEEAFNWRSSGCGWRWDDGANATLQRLKHLSPEAAICMSYINTFGYSCYHLNPELLESIHPQPIPEVAIYLRRELSVQECKMNYADKVRTAFAKGEMSLDMDEANCCDGPVAECSDEPAGYCCG